MKIRSLLERILPPHTRSVFRGMATLASGSLIGRVLGVISAPFITRIYTPEDYGTASVFIALVAITAPFLNLRFAQAIPLPRSDKLAARLAHVSIASTLILTFIVGGFLALSSESLLVWLSPPQLLPWWWLILLGAVAISIFEVFSMWATRARAYGAISRATVLQAVSGELIKVTLGILELRPLGLMLGSIGNQAAGISALFIYGKAALLRALGSTTLRNLYCTVLLYRAYPTTRLASHILLVISMQAPVILIAKLYGSDAAGQFGLAMMALAVPVTMLGDNISRAYYAEISHLGRRRANEVRQLTYSVLARLLAISLPCALPLVFWGADLFTLVFGGEWTQAGKISSFLAITMVAQFLQKPASFLLFLFNGQTKLFYINLQRLVLTIGAVGMASALSLSVEHGIAIYASVIALHYFASIVIAVHQIPRDPQNASPPNY